MFFSHGSNNARGVAILFRSGFDVNIDAVKRDGQGRLLVIKGKLEDNAFTIVNIYAPNVEGAKTFYKNLYTSKRVDLNGEDSIGFFENENIPKLSEEFKEICEGRIRIDEITEVLKSFKDNKVPGIDGLPAEFYKAFWHLLGETLVDSLNAAFDSGRLSISQRQAIVTLIDNKR